MGWLASLTVEDEGRQDFGLPWVVCEYEDVFPDELSGLPSRHCLDGVKYTFYAHKKKNFVTKFN